MRGPPLLRFPGRTPSSAAAFVQQRFAADSGAAPAKANERWSYRYPLRHRLRGALNQSYPRDVESIERAAAKLMRQPDKAAEVMSKLPPEDRRIVALSWALTELEEEFSKADTDKDGKLSYKEFKAWAQKVIDNGRQRDVAADPTRYQLACVALSGFVPFIGFGAVDNGLMVIYGDVIDGTLGVMFGFSMLASAALGNAISNIFGMLSHGTIHKASGKLGMPEARLTLHQQKLPAVHYSYTFGSTVGVFLGCLLGMAPLLFMDQTAKEEQRAHNKHDSIEKETARD